MNHKYVVLLTALILATSTFARYAKAETIKVGALLCLSGVCADVGTNSLKGMQLAVEQLKQKDNAEIELIVENSDELSGSGPVSAYHALRRKFEKAFIVGPTWSVGGMSIAPLASKDQEVLMISPSVGVGEFNESGEQIFNIWPHDDVGTKALAERAYKSGNRKISIIVTIAPWELTQAKTFKTEFERLGGQIEPYIEYPMNEMDFKTYALKIYKSKSDGVLLSNYNHMGLFSKELKTYGYKGKKYASYIDKIQVEQSKGNLEGVEFCFQPEGSKEFTDAYVKKFNEKPNTSADTAYDALNLIYKSIKETKSQDPAVVSKHMLTIKSYQGASGEITFDNKGGITRPPAFFVLKGEAYERIE